MKKKIVILVCVLGLLVTFGLSRSSKVEASFSDAPYAETARPTK